MYFLKHIYKSTWLLLWLFLTVFLASAQDRDVLAHIVTDISKSEGVLVRLEGGTSTRYVELCEIDSCVGFFCGDDYYVSLKQDDTDETPRFSCGIVDMQTIGGDCEYFPVDGDFSKPLSAVFHSPDSIVYFNYYDTHSNVYMWRAMQCTTDLFNPSIVLDDSICMEIPMPYYALCATSEGDVYGFSYDACLYRIDRFTGQGEKLFTTGFIGQIWQSAWYDEDSGLIYRAVPSSVGVTIYSYDLAQKIESFEKIYPALSAIVAMSPLTDDLNNVGLPMPVSDLTVSIRPGMNSGYVSFVAPTNDVNGNKLNGALSHVITLDNSAIDTISSLPGETCRNEYDFPAGQHILSVAVVNEVGRSMASKCNFFAGYDLPKPLDKVAISCDFPYVYIGWSSPEGIHGEAIDADNLRYRVVRYPENVVVADTMATQICDSLNSIPGYYYYGVSAYLPDYATEETYSVSFYYDCGAQLPYKITEWNDNVLRSCVIEDANEDGATWGLLDTASGGKAVRYLYSGCNDADDYLYLPKMQLDSSMYYVATLYMRAGSEKYSENFSVGIATVGDDMLRQEWLSDVCVIDKNSNPYEMAFAVQESGLYRLYVHCTSPANHDILFVDSVLIEPRMASDVPVAVSDMILIPDVGNPHKVTIECLAPTSCLNGSMLQDFINVYLYRDDILVHTFSNPVHGEKLVYCDSVGEIATYEYKAVVGNTHGIGPEVVRRVVRGVAAFPFSHDFTEGIGYFTVKDNNGDGTTWHYYEERYMGCMRYMSSEVNAADDWLISPPIYLDNSLKYQVEYSCCVGLSIYPESLRVLLGTLPQPNTMSVVDVLQDFTFINDTSIIAPFNIAHSGEYYIAFQVNTPTDGYSVLLRNMAVNEYDPLSVQSVTDADCRVWSAKGTLNVSSDTKTDVKVFDLSGTLVDNFETDAGQYTVAISQGVYFVKVGAKVHKVIVR